MTSLALTMIGHIGSAAYLAANRNKSKFLIFLIALNFVAAFFYLWATYAGYLIRQGIPFAYHLQVAITSFFFSVSAHILSALNIKINFKSS
jgi:hypothetical protein